MDHSSQLLNSLQDNLLRHLHVMYSTVISQNNVLTLAGNEIWIINTNAPQQKSAPSFRHPTAIQILKHGLMLLSEYKEINLRQI